MFLKAYTNAFLMLAVILLSWSFGWSDTIIVYPLERRPIYPSKGVGPALQELPYAECGNALEATSVDIVWYYVVSSEGNKGYIQI